MAIKPPNSLSANSRSGLINKFSGACETVSQLWKFACVGALATLIQFGILVLLVQRFGFDPVVASVIGYLVSVCFNYYLNCRITFKATAAHKRTVVMFGLTMGTGLFLNAVVMSFCLNILSLKYVFAQVVATGCVFVWNFTVNKLWTFRAAVRRPGDHCTVPGEEGSKESICPK
ncbi:MAG: GtrA family protein [Syntrophobacteraceae bacterium]